MNALHLTLQAAESANSTGGVNASALAVAVMVAVSLMTLSYIGKAVGPLMRIVKNVVAALVTLGAGSVLLVYGLFYL